MNKKIAGAALVAAALVAGPAAAHHSFAMFDVTKIVTFKGTVKTVQWTNPHVWVEVTVTENGAAKAYAFEGGAIAVLKRFGWSSTTLKEGDTVTLATHPFKNGRLGGSIENVTLADGKKLSAGDGIPGAIVTPGG